MKRIHILVLLLFLLSGALPAQDVSFYTQAPRQVSVGQRFYLTFTVNQEGIGFISPEIQHFEVLSGPNLQTSSQIQGINGKFTQTVAYSYTFMLSAIEPGTFTILPAKITVKGKLYQSNTVSIMVTGKATQPQASAPNHQQPRGSQPQANSSAPDADIFMKAVANRNNSYLGEEIIVTYKLYTPIQVQIVPTDQSPAYPGFWSQSLMKELQQYPQYIETVNGKKYKVVEVNKIALFPQKTGLLTISPLEQDVVYGVKVKGHSPISDDPFFSNDPFFKSLFDDSNFGFNVQNVQKTIRSNPLTIQVKPLPSLNKPVDFSGAVGQFSFKSALDRNELSVNEAITLKLTVSGSGNLNLIEKPAVTFPPDFEVYDPKISDNIHASPSGVSGSRTFEYLVIPRSAGDFKIAPIQFSYFDLAKNDFVRLSSPEFKIKVLKSDGSASSGTPVVREDVKYIGNDIRYIMDTPLALHATGIHFYGSWLFWLLLSIPALLFTGFIILWRSRLKLSNDAGLLRRRKATRVATQKLKKAKALLAIQSQEAFHIEISQALWGYISDKFDIPLAELSMDTAYDRLSTRNVDVQLSERFIETLQHCEFARFAPGDKAHNMEILYKEAISVITDTEEHLK